MLQAGNATMCFFVSGKMVVVNCVCVCVCRCVWKRVSMCVYTCMCVCALSCLSHDHFALSLTDEGGGSPMSSDFCKRLGTFLGPRLAQISAEITEAKEKNKSKDPKLAWVTACCTIAQLTHACHRYTCVHQIIWQKPCTANKSRAPLQSRLSTLKLNDFYNLI